MITEAQYQRRTEAEWKKLRVRSLRPLANGLATVPAGTIFSITRKMNGFGLKADPCPHCGIQIHIYKVEPRALEVVEDTLLNQPHEERTDG